MLKWLLAGPVLLLGIAWGSAALWFDGPSARPLAGLLSAAFALASLGVLLAARSFRIGIAGSAALFLGVLLWWSAIDPSNERAWQPDVARAASAVFDGDLVTIQNVRNFDYRTESDYTERWEERVYDLSKLRGADLFLSYWGSPMIAHTIVSWEFEDGPPLAISIETRKEQGETYSAVLGFFRQFELYYVVADEHDLVGLRTNHRGEDVYLYRLSTPKDVAQAILRDYLEEVNRLVAEPRWYNALTHNCTTTIRRHAQHVAPGNPWSWKILVNGYIDEMGYSRGTIDTSLPFEELRKRSNITQAAKAADRDPSFSARIREGLPGERK
ncbi:MAG: DUF4105 domain-containing protein [bacterium]|nr:DUF4105 domain-containing protein [bacterium]